ncbi:MAG: MBL fold metallo-hydrolase [Erysipelotrichaceae bacterium]|nr:MBL fold metallo-hydrolase [Erysipelotrichaceae bacterium]
MRLLPNVYQVAGNMYGSYQNIFVIEAESFLILVDTGFGQKDRELIFKNIQRFHLQNKPVRYVLLTHEHIEHVFNGKWFQDNGAKIIAHESAANAIIRGGYSIGSYRFPEASFETFEADMKVRDGDVLDLEGIQVKVIHTPGHSDGSVFYQLHINDVDVVFSGDTILLEELCHKVRFGWTGGFDYDEEKFIETMKKISTMNAEVLLPGHGEVCLYHAYREFFGAWLRCRLDIVNNHNRHPLKVEESLCR